MTKRTRLPSTRRGIVHTVTIGGKILLTFNVGVFDDGRPGELFGLEVERIPHKDDPPNQEDASPMLMGLLDAWATDTSLLWQSGYPVEEWSKKHTDVNFDPSGWTDNPDIHSCRSVVDYIAKFLFHHYVKARGDTTK